MNAAPPARPRLPLTVIGGFLGAGKTTLLNRLLQQSQGRRLAVLVNDFGALNIDAELIASNAGDTIALTNGCVCCSIGDDLTAALIRVIEATEPFDAVVIEASGVSDPWRIAQVALADAALGLDGVIVLVDASACLAHRADPLLADSLVRQLKAADLIVVNKIDLVDAAERARVHEWLASVAARTARFDTAHADVPLALLSSSALRLDAPPETGEHERRQPPAEHGERAKADGNDGFAVRRANVDAGGGDEAGEPERAHPDDHDHDHGHDHPGHDHADLFDTWSCRPTVRYAASALRTLLREMPGGVLRLKGIVRTDEHGWAELQFAGRHGSLRAASAAPADGAAIVAIGLRPGLPVEALRVALLRAQSPDS